MTDPNPHAQSASGGECPVDHGQGGKGGGKRGGHHRNRDWWPTSLDIGMLHNNSAKSDPLGPELSGALTRWVDAARAVASAIETDIGPSPFNDAINELNDSRTVALDLCDAAY